MALLKKLLDNALDACEIAGVPAEVEVELDEDGMQVPARRG